MEVAIGIFLGLCAAGWLGVAGKIVPVFRKRDLLKHKRLNGYTNGFWIVVASDAPNPRSTIEHERVHVNQAWGTGFIIHSIAYRIAMPYRRWAETHAYAASVRHGRDITDAARALQRHGYKSLDAARAAIREAM